MKWMFEGRGRGDIKKSRWMDRERRGSEPMRNDARCFEEENHQRGK